MAKKRKILLILNGISMVLLTFLLLSGLNYKKQMMNNASSERKFDMYTPGELEEIQKEEKKEEEKKDTSKDEEIVEKEEVASEEETSSNVDLAYQTIQANNIYAKRHIPYVTKYDANAMTVIKYLSNIFVYDKNINEELSNQELLQMGMDIYLRENLFKTGNDGKKFRITEDIRSGKQTISLADINKTIYEYFGKTATGEDIKSFFYSELNTKILFTFNPNINAFVYKEELSDSGIADLSVYTRYISSSYNVESKLLTMSVANVYSASAFCEESYYYSAKTTNDANYKVISIKENKCEDYDPYEDLYNLPLNKLQKVTYIFDVSSDTYKLVSINVN